MDESELDESRVERKQVGRKLIGRKVGLPLPVQRIGLKILSEELVSIIIDIIN